MSVKKSTARKSAPAKSVTAKSGAAKSAAAQSAAPKSESESPPATGPGAATSSAAAADAEVHAKSYVLPALVARTTTGTAITAEQVMLYIDLSPEQLVAMGQKVSTERIDVDAARLYGTGYDFFLAATPAQRAALPGLTMQRLRVSIWAAAQGQAKNRAALATEERHAAEQAYRITDAKQIKEQAGAVREVLYATVFALTGGQKRRVEELGVAYGRAAKPQDLTSSLSALADLYDRYLGDSDAKITARRAEMTIDGALSLKARTLAQQVLVQGSAIKAPRAATSNAEVDLWDGINLLLLDQMITLFDAGHLLDPTVPRLLPLSLRGWFGTSRPKATAAKPDSAPAAPAA